MNDFQVLHGAERGETAALLLSPLRPANQHETDIAQNGSQFTFFLTAPIAAFCQLVDHSSSDTESVSKMQMLLYLLKIHYSIVGLICFSACRMFTMMLRTYSQLPSLNGK